MSKEEFLKLSDLDKVKYAIEESLKEHKSYKSEYWKGSAFMGESILQTIEQVKKFAIADVNQQHELLTAFANYYNNKADRLDSALDIEDKHIEEFKAVYSG